MKSRRKSIIASALLQINVMSVAEVCRKFNEFILNPSIDINQLIDLNSLISKYFDVRKLQSVINNDSNSSDRLITIFQIPVILCEIEYLQRSLDTRDLKVDVDHDLQNKLDLRDKLSNDLCVTLRELMRSQEIRNISHQQDGIALEDLLYEISLTLANTNPVNDIDFATQEPIVPENRIVTSDRYQHDINSLDQWLRHKNTNPWTNLKFDNRDINYIKSVIQSRKTRNMIRSSEENTHLVGDPRLEATLELVQTLQQQSQNQFRNDGDLDVIQLIEYYWGAGPHPMEQQHVHVANYDEIPIRDLPSIFGFFKRQTLEPYTAAQFHLMIRTQREAYLRELMHEVSSPDEIIAEYETYERLDV